jgi:hypothetical protein
MRKNALEAQKEANWTETREVLEYFSLKIKLACKRKKFPARTGKNSLKSV